MSNPCPMMVVNKITMPAQPNHNIRRIFFNRKVKIDVAGLFLTFRKRAAFRNKRDGHGKHCRIKIFTLPKRSFTYLTTADYSKPIMQRCVRYFCPNSRRVCYYSHTEFVVCVEWIGKCCTKCEIRDYRHIERQIRFVRDTFDLDRNCT